MSEESAKVCDNKDIRSAFANASRSKKNETTLVSIFQKVLFIIINYYYLNDLDKRYW